MLTNFYRVCLWTFTKRISVRERLNAGRLVNRTKQRRAIFGKIPGRRGQFDFWNGRYLTRLVKLVGGFGAVTPPAATLN
jgi:hypothetical protein